MRVVQLRTSSFPHKTTTGVLVYVLLHCSEPHLNRIRKVSEFWYMYYLYNSEPKVLHNNQSLLFWYMYYLYSSEPTQTHFTVLVYALFAQLRTNSFICTMSVRFGVCVFCAAQNHILLLNLHHHSFSICVFAQFRTEHLHLRQRDLALVCVFLIQLQTNNHII